VLALRAAGYGPGDAHLDAAARWLRRQQNRDGGFGFQVRGGPSDVDDTAAALQALAAAGRARGRSAHTAVAFLRRTQNRDGGFPQQRDGSSNAQSTAWAIQGLAAAGLDASAVTRAGSRSPVAYLRSLVAPDGSVRYSRTGSQTPVWVTAQALTGLAQRPLPVSPVARAHRAGAGGSDPAGGSDRAGAKHAPLASALGVLEGAVHAIGDLVAVLVGAAALA
jgi:prenyltransferase beta subunit